MTPETIERVFGRGRLKMATGEHVEVYREAVAPGERRRYTKRFLATGDADFREWTEREWRILARLIGHGVRCVPDVVQFDGGASGGMRQVQTYDAGVTVDQWATLLPVGRGALARRHVFEDCAHWWALAHHCLASFEEIHALQLVHLDVKADNVCIPYAPGDFDHGAPGALLAPAFDRLALIDFAFSVVSREPLSTPLPLGWQKDYDYQSPRLLAALEAARKGDLRPTRELDWRCDLYSLAAMLRRYLPDDAWADAEGAAFGWTRERHDAARLLIFRLREIHDRDLPVALPHRDLMDATAAQLAEPDLAASLAAGWTLRPDFDSADATALITPLTRIAARVACRPPGVPPLRAVGIPMPTVIRRRPAAAAAVTVVRPTRLSPIVVSPAVAPPTATSPSAPPGKVRVHAPRVVTLACMAAALVAAAVPGSMSDPAFPPFEHSERMARAESFANPGGGDVAASGSSAAGDASVGSGTPDLASAASPAASTAASATAPVPSIAEPAVGRTRSSRNATQEKAPSPSSRTDADIPTKAGEATERTVARRSVRTAGATLRASAPPRTSVADASPTKGRTSASSPVAGTARRPDVSARPPRPATPAPTAPHAPEPTVLAANATTEAASTAASPVTDAPRAVTVDSSRMTDQPTAPPTAPSDPPLRSAPPPAAQAAIVPPARAPQAPPVRVIPAPSSQPTDAFREGLHRFFQAFARLTQRPAPVEERPRAPAAPRPPTDTRIAGASPVPAPSTYAQVRPPQPQASPPIASPAPPPPVRPDRDPPRNVTSDDARSPAWAPSSADPGFSNVFAEPSPAPVAVASRPETENDLGIRARRLLAESLPSRAEEVRQDAADALWIAAQAEDPAQNRDVIRAASALWRSEQAFMIAPSDMAQSRRLHEAAAYAFANRRVRDALETELRAFAANPRDPDIAGYLAFLHLQAAPIQPETARQLALHALALSGSRRAVRLNDWSTLAVANALTGRDQEATRAWLVQLALTNDPDRTCQAAQRAFATYGEPLRSPLYAMIQRVNAQGRAHGAPSCAWPTYRTASRWP